MKTLLLLATGAGLCFSATQTFTGVVTDAMCGADHKMMDVHPETKCVTECVRMGSKYALQVGANVYELSDQKTSAAFAAKKVKVTGALNGKVLQVQSIQAAK